MLIVSPIALQSTYVKRNRQVRSPYVIRESQIVRVSSGFLECNVTAAYVFKGNHCGFVYVQQPPWVHTGSVHPSKFVRCACVTRKIFIEIHQQTIHKNTYNQLWLRNLTVKYKKNLKLQDKKDITLYSPIKTDLENWRHIFAVIILITQLKEAFFGFNMKKNIFFS